MAIKKTGNRLRCHSGQHNGSTLLRLIIEFRKEVESAMCGQRDILCCYQNVPTTFIYLDSIKDAQEEQQSQNIAYQWHQVEEKTNQDIQYTSYRPKNSKANSSIFPNNKVITMLDSSH